MFFTKHLAIGLILLLTTINVAHGNNGKDGDGDWLNIDITKTPVPGPPDPRPHPQPDPSNDPDNPDDPFPEPSPRPRPTPPPKTTLNERLHSLSLKTKMDALRQLLKKNEKIQNLETVFILAELANYDRQWMTRDLARKVILDEAQVSKPRNLQLKVLAIELAGQIKAIHDAIQAKANAKDIEERQTLAALTYSKAVYVITTRFPHEIFSGPFMLISGLIPFTLSTAHDEVTMFVSAASGLAAASAVFIAGAKWGENFDQKNITKKENYFTQLLVKELTALKIKVENPAKINFRRLLQIKSTEACTELLTTGDQKSLSQ